MTLTPAQREALRQINLAQIYGLHAVARWLLAGYFEAWPEHKTLYVRLHGGKELP